VKREQNLRLSPGLAREEIFLIYTEMMDEPQRKGAGPCMEHIHCWHILDTQKIILDD
jgi:hypothetical protein